MSVALTSGLEDRAPARKSEVMAEANSLATRCSISAMNSQDSRDRAIGVEGGQDMGEHPRVGNGPRTDGVGRDAVVDMSDSISCKLQRQGLRPRMFLSLWFLPCLPNLASFVSLL